MSSLRDEERRALRKRVETVARASDALGRPLPAWIERPLVGVDPLSLFAAAAGGDRFLWEERGSDVMRIGIGAAATLLGVGRARLRDVDDQAKALFAGLAPVGARMPSAPFLVGGFAFGAEPSSALWRGYPQARFVLPSHLLVRRNGQVRHTLTALVPPRASIDAIVSELESGWALLSRRAGESPLRRAGVLPVEGAASEDGLGESGAAFHARANQPHARYRALVREALASIRDGALEKVVVARSCTLTRPGGFDPLRMLETLRAAHPSCVRFAVGVGDGTLVAATPERLLRREGRRIETSALAGSAPRGRTPEEDARLGKRLRESKKEQEEHAVVVRALRALLEACCDRVDAAEAPELLRLEGIQHLHTPIEGWLREDDPVSFLDLADRLHPSPAVAGAPRPAALAWLRGHEGLDRGWYAGAVGWISPGGDGELAVALRTALLRGDDALLHAGAGIVAGSTPEAELDETRLKLRAGLTALLEI
jgi:isochorismate synthase